MTTIKRRAARFAKALLAAGSAGLTAGLAVALQGPADGSSPETYLSAVVVAILTGAAVALGPANTPKA